MAAATLPTMTTRGDAVAREKDHTSYCTLFQDLEGYSSYVRDVGYRTPHRGWLVEIVLNLLPCSIGDIPNNGDDRRREGRGRLDNVNHQWH
jgi:hypothetical protein